MKKILTLAIILFASTACSAVIDTIVIDDTTITSKDISKDGTTVFNGSPEQIYKYTKVATKDDGNGNINTKQEVIKTTSQDIINRLAQLQKLIDTLTAEKAALMKLQTEMGKLK